MKTIFVTGAASGIGRATASLFARLYHIREPRDVDRGGHHPNARGIDTISLDK